MSKIGSVIALSAGGTAVFTMAYVGVASMQGASFQDVPPFSWVQPKTPPPETDAQPALPVPDPRQVDPVVPQMTAGVLGAFVMPSPFDSRELQALQTKLTERLAGIDAIEKELEGRRRELDDWQRSLEARAKELNDLRGEIEGVKSPESPDTRNAKGAQDAESWRAMSPLFQEGDADDMALKLSSFEPEEAAQILHGLEPDRAAELLNALPTASYKPVLDAWRRSQE